MSVDLSILLLSDIANLFLGISIFLRSPHAIVNRIFAALSLSLITWSTLNFAADQALEEGFALWLTRATLLSGVLILLSVLFLSRHLPRNQSNKNLFNSVQIPLGIVVGMLVFTPVVIRSVAPTAVGANLQVGPLYVVYVLFLVQGSLVTVGNFISQYKTAHEKAEKNQIALIMLGLMLFALFTIIFNALLPVLVDDWKSSRFGPVFSLFIVGLTGYAIVRHRLFDIQLILARSVGYVFSVIFLAVIYGAVVFGAAQLIFDIKLSLPAQIFLSLATGIAGLTFQSLRKKFDTLTKRIFYRDAYEPQELFDSLNKVLVSTVDIEKLLRQSSASIMESLRAGYCAIALKENNRDHVRIVGTQKLQFDEKDMVIIRKLTPFVHQSVIATDYLDDDHAELKAVLTKNRVAVLVRLSSNTKKAEEGLGYIILGSKKSGNAYTGQDFKVLDTVANELIIAIQNALRYEEIENFAVTLQEKVAEATRKLRRTNEKLKELDEAKDDFVSMASHQLRTPLTSIKGYTSMVLEGDAGKINATQRKLLEQSYISSQRMVYLIADLLNVSRLKTGKFLIERSPVNLAAIVAEEIGQLTETAASRQLTLVYEQPESFPTILLDETKTRQVIMNFVDNAIYYTAAGGHIEVKLHETASSVELRVIDDGMGVPDGERPHLFTKFYRAGNARKARPDGTGLGLFMAKKVIMAEGGAIIFQSKEGQGSTFGFIFSKKDAVPTY